MSNILSRIQEIALNEGITIAALERSIGASKGVLSRAIANGTDIQSKWLQNIVENYPSYSAEWLIAGRGFMLRYEVATTGVTSTISTLVQDDNFVSIPLVDISVAAGCCGYDNPDYLEAVDTIKMPSSMVRDGRRYFCVHIKGESMSPTLLDSSYVVVRLLERSEWQDMPDRHVYVVSDRDGRAYIKRIKNRFSKHGFIVCMSDNIDKVNYPNFNLEEQEINSILHAEWYFSAKMPNLNETYYDKVNQLEDKYDILEGQMKRILQAISIK
ncbi:S24 family peptidase [uncultured Bacteroides sp.]|jgi:phage repressor protein C with HTH and peptisase S24 domain|uniref:S24 family peptidase n=1 Tax=uncultured Bacteroides sp. TaxID=162156 RepID=UPI0025D2BB3D|nr:S24 family peptidase [uncultured Bacteroides sp.]